MCEDTKISIERGVKKIQVNDEGECILLPMGDQAFISDLLALTRNFDAVSAQYYERVSEIEKMPDSTQREALEKVSALAAANLEICNTLKASVDATFRDEVCRKVFGNITPSLSAFTEFFAQLSSLVQTFGAELNEERRAKIEKYTAKYHK